MPCLMLRIFDQELRRIHDFGEAGLVVGPEQRGAVRRDDVVADLVGERGMIGGADHWCLYAPALEASIGAMSGSSTMSPP